MNNVPKELKFNSDISNLQFKTYTVSIDSSDNLTGAKTLYGQLDHVPSLIGLYYTHEPMTMNGANVNIVRSTDSDKSYSAVLYATDVKFYKDTITFTSTSMNDRYYFYLTIEDVNIYTGIVWNGNYTSIYKITTLDAINILYI